MIICKLNELMEKNQILDFGRLARETEITKDVLIRLAENQWHQIRREHLDCLCQYFDCGIEDLLEYQAFEGSVLPA
ncbi:MAG: helix-turn-helix transcriptional regulator [Deltaproteobacteria bacterium]|nr:helix-turn-helix transcriptional regulator [Deltaproteobacteria bacterium]MBW1952502.1 helix-turn-helix transcriptional regulator [Deltaproteobacteria bacterium]MBW1987553.1 helix-turn-helix transcriptional regulator [Deltaproteobacteria bacterium]MBW2135315.1 helix-turn-helix transcriptional regulator [Deltaproteobacteria bacterium]